jgi:hypothetical protein
MQFAVDNTVTVNGHLFDLSFQEEECKMHRDA